MEYRGFERRDLTQVIGLCQVEGWESYVADPERTYRALTAANVICLVATEGEAVVGFAQCLTDGAIRAYLANMVVASSRRGTGIGRGLIKELQVRCQAAYIDLLSTDGAESFYETFRYQKLPGYRIYPG
jgi:predicted N-acetyltransferase YhbS